MPIYVYKCIKCHKETEKYFSSIPKGFDVTVINCPECGEFSYKIIKNVSFLGEKNKGNW